MTGHVVSRMERAPGNQCVNDDVTSQEIQRGEEEIQREAQTEERAWETKRSTGQQTLVPIKKGLPEEQRDKCSTHKERSEGNVVFPFDHVRSDQSDPHN